MTMTGPSTWSNQGRHKPWGHRRRWGLLHRDPKGSFRHPWYGILKMSRCRAGLVWVFLVFFSACATPCPPEVAHFPERLKGCQDLLNRLDETVAQAGVKDGSSFSVPCFSYLRSNRFLSALKKTLRSDRERADWLRWMQQLDLAARNKEIRNLPDEAVLSLNLRKAGAPDRRGLFRRVLACSGELLDHHQGQWDACEPLDPRVEVPDEYSFFMRAAGLYPLTSIPVIIVTRNVREKIRSRFHLAIEALPVEGALRTFAPAQARFLGETGVRKRLETSRANALRVPRPNQIQERELVASFAPVFVQDVAASYDRFGRVVWKGGRVAIEPGKPTVYWYLSNAFLEGEAIVQINYVIWYAKRAGKNAPWMERGNLDGLTVRISLDPKGRPFMVDVMNNCGCYHFFSPQKGRVHRVASKPFGLDPFVPQWLPRISPEKRFGIRINSGWHQVERLLAAGAPRDAAPYDLVPYEALEALAHENGRSESLFNERGLAKGSDRIEPWILFSMGVPSVGSMRQRGNHPIALTGRCHFDDPYLFEEHFVFRSGEP